MALRLVGFLFLFGLFLACDTNDPALCIDESKICDGCACTREYVPVCGCDEVTYSNSCEADKAGVTSFSDGACDN